MIKTYILPDKLRRELKKIWGIPFFGNKSEVKKKFKEFIQKKRFKKIITVGDYCSLNLSSDIKIFDGKIGRKKIKIPFKLKRLLILNCSNPPSTIQSRVWPVIKKAIKENRNVFIKGEEDLLVIPSVLLSEKNSVVVYGFPKKGVCLIEVSPEIKKVFKKLLKKFKTNKLS
jgi:uncharacterized protein (UPF0218 family)